MMLWLLFTSHFMNHMQASHIAKHGSQITNVYKILLHKICLKNQCFFLHHNARMLMETTFIISFTKLSPFTKETQSVSPDTHPPLKEYQRFCPTFSIDSQKGSPFLKYPALHSFTLASLAAA
jgi:hypothetical protein